MLKPMVLGKPPQFTDFNTSALPVKIGMIFANTSSQWQFLHFFSITSQALTIFSVPNCPLKSVISFTYIYIYIPWSHHEIPWNHHFLSIFHPIVPGQCLQDGREFPRAERVEEAALRGATHPFRGGGWSARPGADAWTWWHFLMAEAWPKSQTGYITIYDILIYI